MTDAVLWRLLGEARHVSQMSQVVARWKRVPLAASLREFVISRGRRTSWPSRAALEQMDDDTFEAYIHAVGLDTRIARARATRVG